MNIFLSVFETEYIFALIYVILNVVSSQEKQWSLNDLIPANYDKSMVPMVNGTAPKIKISMEIAEIVAVTESDQSITLDFFFYQYWTDYRLKVKPNMTTPIVLDQTWGSKIWTPDTYFRNSLSVSVLSNFAPILFYVITNGNNVTQVARMNGKFECKMNLGNYPQDTQYCTVDIVSATKSIDMLTLEWDHFTIQRHDSSKFRVRNYWTGNCVKTNFLGEFSCLQGTVKLVRRVSYYVIRVYAPSFLTVIASFVGFWIPVLGWPARVALLVTPLLTLVTQDISVNNEINVNYVCALHWWMMWCIFFVFMGLIEYAVAISWAHFVNDKKAARAASGGMPTDVPKGHYFGNKSWFYVSGKIIGRILEAIFGPIDFTKDPLTRNKVDYASRIIFPTLYISFVLIYIFASVCPWAVDYN